MAAPSDNKNAVKHSGEAALADIKSGTSLRGPAKEAEEDVRTELETIGRAEIVTQGAVRLEAVARLFYNAFVEAANQGDLAGVDRYAKRYGWLQNSALRAWEQVGKVTSEEDDTIVLDAIGRAKDNG